jgi:hypothetical protein
MASSTFFSCRVEDPGILGLAAPIPGALSGKAEKLPLFGCDNVDPIQ